uniref:RNA-binding protein 4 n=1 Tax=Rhipicephalus appendiculatus TaxID=34631 RepID=A0A131Z439_RHIAP
MPKLYVGSLPEGCDTASLEALFAKYGKVEECDIVKNYAFVHMNSEEESKLAIDALHNSEFMGGKITVEASHSKVRPKPGMGGRGQCYRCGRQGHWSKECPRNPNARFGSGVPMMPPGGGLARYPGVGGPERLGYGSGGPDRFMDRGGAYGDRGFGAAPGYGDRMRPYPDPYERRAAPPPPPSAARDDFYYYRRPYEDFGSSYYGSQDGPSQSYGNGYRFWPTARSEWTGPQDLSAKVVVVVLWYVLHVPSLAGLPASFQQRRMVVVRVCVNKSRSRQPHVCVCVYLRRACMHPIHITACGCRWTSLCERLLCCYSLHVLPSAVLECCE